MAKSFSGVSNVRDQHKQRVGAGLEHIGYWTNIGAHASDGPFQSNSYVISQIKLVPKSFGYHLGAVWEVGFTTLISSCANPQMKTEDLPTQFQTPGLLALSQIFVLW